MDFWTIVKITTVANILLFMLNLWVMYKNRKYRDTVIIIRENAVDIHEKIAKKLKELKRKENE